MRKSFKYTVAFTLAASLLSTNSVFASTSKKPFRTNFVKESEPLPFLKSKNETSETTYVVKYKNSISSSIHKRAGMNMVKSFPTLGYDIVKIQSGKKLASALSVYNQYSDIVSISPSVQYKYMSTAANPKEDEAYHLAQLKISSAQKLVANKPITVAVIDQGVDTSHPDLSGRILGSYNVVNPASKGAREFHGTHVAGIIAATKNNKLGAYGVNPNAKILSVNVFDGNPYTSDYTISEGILYAVQKGAKVINMSLGGTTYSQLLDDTIQYAVSKGVVVVAAAGNSGINEYSYPASYDGVISVGATNSERKLTSFSTYGPGVDVVAPGEFIYSTIYDPAIGSTYYYLSGTSMATPIVSGIASLLKTKHPSLSSYDVEQILEETATDRGTTGYDIKYGYGLVDPVKALSYDLKKLASYKPISEAGIFSSASTINLSANNEASLNGSITKPHQTFRYKVNVKSGDAIGLTLKMAKDYDDQMSLRFYEGASTKSSKPVIIDEVLAGKDEGTVYQAPKDGRLVIEVKDKNSRYSLQGKSTFTLGVKHQSVTNGDTATKSNPYSVTNLPFNTEALSNPLQLFNKGEIGARYIAFQPTDEQAVLMSLEAIPGVNSSINIYLKDEWDQYLGRPDKNQLLPMYSIDTNGKSVGEKGSFTFMKDKAYVIEISSSPNTIFTLPKYDEQPNLSVPYTGSLENVKFSMSNLNLPEDEDGLTNSMTIEDSNYLTQNVGLVDTNDTQQIIDQARPITQNAASTAYIQSDNDADWYKYTPSNNNLTQFNLNGKKEQLLNAELYVYNTEKNKLEFVSSSNNYYIDHSYIENNQDIFTGLEKGRTYYVRVSSFGGVTDLPYKLTLKSHGELGNDEFEPNNYFENASPIKSYNELYGNFSSSNDVDYYYFKNTSSQTILKGFEFMAFPLSEDETGTIPKMLTEDTPINVTVYEDTNGNKKLDGTESEKGSFYQNYGDFTKGSFQAKPKYGYFIEVANAYTDIPNIHQYGFRFYSMNRVDEDAKAKYKNGLPSIMLPLKKSGSSTYVGNGYLNANVANGDKDYFRFVNDKTRTISFSLEMPAVGMNGKVSFYDSKGKRIASFDRYTFNDSEVGQITLKKGNYYIRVEEVNGVADYDQYQLIIQK